MVAMDTGESAKVALFAALDLMKPQDHLYVACIVQEVRTVSSYKYPSYMPSSIGARIELDNARKKAKEVCDIVARICEVRRVCLLPFHSYIVAISFALDKYRKRVRV